MRSGKVNLEIWSWPFEQQISFFLFVFFNKTIQIPLCRVWSLMIFHGWNAHFLSLYLKWSAWQLHRLVWHTYSIVASDSEYSLIICEYNTGLVYQIIIADLTVLRVYLHYFYIWKENGFFPYYLVQRSRESYTGPSWPIAARENNKCCWIFHSDIKEGGIENS